MARRSLILLLLAGIALIAPALAGADGDPASDYLLGQLSFVPPDAGVPAADAAQLRSVLADAKAHGYEIRVALISSRYDMGSVGVLYLHPKQYAHFLGQELFFVYTGRLLVVMPNGLGVSRAGKAAAADQALIDRLERPGPSGQALAASASKAVMRLAAQAGVAVAVPATTARKHDANRDRAIIALVALAICAAAGGFGLVRRHARNAAS